VKYTIKQHYRRLQGRCLRCGRTRAVAKAQIAKWNCYDAIRRGDYQRHLWNMR